MKKITYGFGINTVLTGEEVVKFASAAECAKQAVAKGYSFIIGYNQNGAKTVISWNARVVSREEALHHYMCDGDKRTILRSSRAKVWIICPVEGFSDILIPFGENQVCSFQAVKLDSLDLV